MGAYFGQTQKIQLNSSKRSKFSGWRGAHVLTLELSSSLLKVGKSLSACTTCAIVDSGQIRLQKYGLSRPCIRLQAWHAFHPTGRCINVCQQITMDVCEYNTFLYPRYDPFFRDLSRFDAAMTSSTEMNHCVQTLPLSHLFSTVPLE